MIDAVVLAGGAEAHPWWAAEPGVTHRPLLEVGGKAMVGRVLAALRGAGEVGAIALVAPPEVQAAVGEEALDFRVEPGSDLLENIERGLAALPAGDSGLLVSADLPLLTSQAVDDFVRAARASGAEFAYPILPREASERSFPGGRRTYVRLREGQFTGGNLILVSRPFLVRHRDLISRLYRWRKRPLRLASLLGFGFVLRLKLGRVALAQAEARASSVLRGRVAAVVSSHPGIGFDVDKPEDLELARALVRAQE
jgi:GTP:adenosylcobinamide-phosphate guanylyltransferase